MAGATDPCPPPRSSSLRLRVGGGVAVIAIAQFVYAVWLLHGQFFFADDFLNFQVAREMGLGRSYLMRSLFGHLEPGHRFVNWAMLDLAHASYDTAVLVDAAAFAACTLLLARLLWLLTDSGSVVIAGALYYAFSATAVSSVMWWSAAVNAWPATMAAIVMVDSALRWWQTRSHRHLVVSTLAFGLGMVFYEKITYLPVIIGLIVLGWYLDGSWHRRLAALARGIWPLAVAYLVVIGLYWGTFLRLGFSREIRAQAKPLELIEYLWIALTQEFIPSLFGLAPVFFRWGSFQFTAVLSTALLVVAVGWSIRRSRSAVLGWVLLFVVFVANAAQVGLARVATGGVTFGREPKYLSDYVWLVVVCLALTWRLVVGHAPRVDSRRLRVAGSVALIGLLSVLAFDTLRSTAAQRERSQGAVSAGVLRTFRESLRSALASNPAAGVYDSNVPGWIVPTQFYPYSRLSVTYGVYVHVPRWNVGTPMLAMGYDGKVHLASIEPDSVVTDAGVVAGEGVVWRPGTGIGCVTTGPKTGQVRFATSARLQPAQRFLEVTAVPTDLVRINSVAISAGPATAPNIFVVRSRPDTRSATSTFAVEIPPVASPDFVTLTVAADSRVCLGGIRIGVPHFEP